MLKPRLVNYENNKSAILLIVTQRIFVKAVRKSKKLFTKFTHKLILKEITVQFQTMLLELVPKIQPMLSRLSFN